ncbi:NADH:flavin oxidoreductase [Pseudomaricurvus alkylphenolicus]|jgi:2,4-dienoyl-CoA reductase-like NADH-dependent reductase (Old Yellow Enzyme family)|uniref:NADH:flavin oxidoreductase n=1 Tax=Pseudomaricurvus alkylphenolicus TaxID=1306991 RepID=UPI00142313CB|nr:NADH:flavin oxidoreductase [Pseudomaricurvus alkylphenolicus]NIB42919.1 NADH:flavin oxidoreductase [Pseudomaricurvus alkylphenolicus]
MNQSGSHQLTSQHLQRAFEPARLGSLELRNRVIKAATYEGKSPGGIPGKELYEFHREICQGGVGMTTIGYCTTEADGRISEEMMFLGDEAREPLKQMITELKHTGARISGQMTHCGHFSKNRNLQRLKRPKGPSPQFNNLGMAVGMFWTDAMTERDIDTLVQSYHDAGVYMKEVGFDAAEIHFSHGYGLSQFISPKTNRRNDRYGGSLENRMRLPLRVLEAVRKAVGDDFPILGKMGLTDAVKGGLSEDEAVGVAKMLDAGGIDALITSGGTSSYNVMHMFRGDSIAEGIADMQPNALMRWLFRQMGPKIFKQYPYKELYFLDGCRRVRDVVKNAQMVYIGGCHTLESLAQVMAEGIDFVQLGRPLIRDPAFVNNAMAAPDTYHSGCTECNRCVTTIEAPGGIVCHLRQ